MKNQDFYQLFLDELADIYHTENQIVRFLPKFIQLASLPELKEALEKHLRETENQTHRLNKIYSILKTSPSENRCEGMQGILAEADELIRNKAKSSLLDATIISAAQKVEHYEIASYGTLRSFAKNLDLDSDIIRLLQDNLDEEGAADKKLSKIADGSFFTSGVNKEAATAGASSCNSSSCGYRD